MKRLVIIAICLLCNIIGFAQKIYVPKSEYNYEEPIIEKLKFEGYKLVDKKEDADLIVECLMVKNHEYLSFSMKGMYEGYVQILDKNENVLIKSKIISRSPAATNGFRPDKNIFSVIAKRYLIDMVNQIKTTK